MGHLRRRAREALAELGHATFPRAGEVSRPSLALHYGVRLVVQVARQAIRDRLPRQAASLSFQTLLSAVPMAVIAFSVLSHLVSSREVGELTDWLSRHTLPSRARAIAPVLQQFASDVNVGALGLFGAIGLFSVGVVLFMNVCQVVNDIWRVQRQRTIFSRGLAAVVLLIWAPLLAGMSVYFAQRFVRIPRSFDLAAPLALTVAGLWLAYKLLPSTRVSALAAAVAALLVGAALEAGKIGFGFYVAEIEVSLRGLYGAIGFVPLALLWLYFSWLLFLFGVELTFTLQNLRTLWFREAHVERAVAGSTAGPGLALAIMHELYGAGPTSRPDLALRLAAAPAGVDLVVDRLVAGGLVTTGRGDLLSPARAAADLPVAEILELFPAPRLDVSGERGRLLRALLDRIDEARDREAAGLTMHDLV
jgi:membrane protein